MTVTIFVLFLIQLAVMLAFGLIFGRLVQRLGFPAIFGELAGIAAGRCVADAGGLDLLLPPRSGVVVRIG